jgi:hypothetical protein
MAKAPSIEAINALLDQRSFGPAFAMATQLTTALPSQAAGWFALGRAAFGLGRQATADHAIDRAMRLGARGHDVELLRAIVDHRLARSDRAITRLRGLVDAGAPNRIDATLALAEVLHRANRRDELATLVADGGAWLDDPRAPIFSARVTLHADRPGTIDRLEAIARGDGPSLARRIAGFDAVRLLDADGAYRRAFDLAAHLHATTGTGFDLEGLLQDAKHQVQLLKRGAFRAAPAATAVRGVAMVVGVPRSGTTLLEQMLDRHPAIQGIGEFEGIARLGDGIVSEGVWPDHVPTLDAVAAKRLQADYLAGIAPMRRSGTSWSFDKTLHAWRWLPAIAAVLPGAVCLRIERDPRDTATSLFLSNFHPQAFGWTGSLESIRQVIAAERELAPLALRTLGIPHEDIRYEDLVEDPRGHMERVLARLGLPMDERVLAPQENARTVLTLSHEQVRKSINRGSIGRWRNYEFAFGPQWA